MPLEISRRHDLHRAWRLASALLTGAAVAACGGGGGGSTPAAAPVSSSTGNGNGTGTNTAPTTTAPAATPTPPAAVLNVGACLPSGISGATDYQVGDGKPYADPGQVPWASLKAGDTVRIFYRATPYRTKFLVAAQGSAQAPVRICGVRGPNNERPIIDGENAVTASTLTAANDYGTAANDVHQTRSIIVVKQLASQAYQAYPQYVQIDGFTIRRAHPDYHFTDASGATRTYDGFGACVWVDRGHNITIADNEISDCTQAIYTKSTDDGDFTVTKNIRIAGNYLWGNGFAGDANTRAESIHTTYTASENLVIEFNHYGPLRSGAGGNSIKDRSAGTVIRYNHVEAGAHSLDLVEAEDFPVTATSLASYRSTMVYGNVLENDSGARAFVHYGGDHFGAPPGANWGESWFRKGTLYFFHNTLYGTGNVRLFRISTTDETVEAWNNVFYATGIPSLRTAENDDVSSSYTPDGTLHLGRNWIRSNWVPGQNGDASALKGTVTGTVNLITGSAAPFDPTALLPLPGSSLLSAALAGPSAASAYTVAYQFDLTTSAGVTRASATALGARQ
jgi:hypothetical protein